MSQANTEPTRGGDATLPHFAGIVCFADRDERGATEAGSMNR